MKDLPDFVKEKIKEYQVQKKTGTLIINFSNGGIRNITPTETLYPPKKGEE